MVPQSDPVSNTRSILGVKDCEGTSKTSYKDITVPLTLIASFKKYFCQRKFAFMFEVIRTPSRPLSARVASSKLI